MRRLAPLALVLVLLAGCFQAEPETTEEQAALVVDENRPAPAFGEVVTGPAVGPDLNATTAAPPRLVEGEWWRIKFVSDFLNEDTQFVRVVANATEEGYIFGMPHEGWYKEAIAYHAPAFGDVGLNLSYNTHNVLFEPVRFPMKAGDKWVTHFAAAPFQAEVEKADETTAVIKLVPLRKPEPTDPVMNALIPFGDGVVRVYFDARMHEVVKMESMIGVWEVVEHGYDFQGWVTVPRGEHTAIDYGTLGPAEPGKPLLKRTITVEGGFNRLTMMHAIFGITPGSYKITSITPDKKEFKTEATGTNTMVLKFYEATNPDGIWNQEDIVLGGGGTYSMGIAYHQYDIQLPDGHRRTDHSHPVVR